MPSVFKKQYTDPIPAGATIVTHKREPNARFRRGRKQVLAPLTADGKRIRLETAKWYGRVPGRPLPVPLSANKAAAEMMLAELVKKAELAKAGVVDPFETHRKRPLAEHLADFEA